VKAVETLLLLKSLPTASNSRNGMKSGSARELALAAAERRAREQQQRDNSNSNTSNNVNNMTNREAKS
jgi:hypothetical protein